METFNSYTVRKRVGCGWLYATIIYLEENNGFNFMQLTVDGENNCGGSYTGALADLLTYSIRRAFDEDEIRAIHKALVGQRCNHYSVSTKLSCSDAIAEILKEEFKKDIYPK